VKFLADMAISISTVGWLRLQGYDVVHVRDVGMGQASDGEILAKAHAEDRVVLTLDLDFGYLLAVSGSQFPSVVLFRLGNETADVVTQRLGDVLDCCAESLASGAFVTVDDTRIRVRRLPISFD